LQESGLPNWVKNSFDHEEQSNPFAELVNQMTFYRESAYDMIFETITSIQNDSTLLDPSMSIQIFLDSFDIDIIPSLKLSYAMFYNEFALADSMILNSPLRDSTDGFFELQDMIIDLYENNLNLFSVWNDTSSYALSAVQQLHNMPYGYTSTIIEKISSIQTEYAFEEEMPVFNLTRMMQMSQTPPEEKVEALFFPNPVHSELNVALNFAYGEKAQCDIYNISGKLANKDYLGFRKTKIDLSNLDSGVYVVKITMPDGSIKLGKIVKE
jgi:hypothetical protein